jgi:serine/threonine-protein kinase
MEYLKGQSLKELVDEGHLPVAQVLGIIHQVCDGLSAVHAAGIVHGDIKPSNVHIGDQGRIKILDFGIAKPKGTERQELSGSTFGTISYMSPEQINGEEVSFASDLFSLGVVMYEALTGRRPFVGDYEAAILYSIVNDTPPAMRTLRADIPVGVEDAVNRLLQKQPSGRYSSAAEFKADLLRKCGERSDAKPARFRNRLTRLKYSVALALLAVLIVIVLYNRSQKDNEERVVEQTLVVVPFENLGSAEESYFADGMTDAFITNLARCEGLRVISRASSMHYKSSGKDFLEFGRELGASHALTGSVHWERDSAASIVRVNAELVQLSDGVDLWADSYERTLDRIFAIQSEIAREVTGNLMVRVSDRSRSATAPTGDLDAYDFYLRGNSYFNRSWDQGDILLAIEMYRKALARDSLFALAYAMLARCHASLYWEHYDRSAERKSSARQAAAKAVKLQPALAEGHLALGYCHYHCDLEYGMALTEFQLALTAEPNNSDLHNAVAAVKRRQGDLVASVENFKRALELDPLSHLKAFDVALTYGMMRDVQNARKYVDMAISLAPDWPLSYVYDAWMHIVSDGDAAAARAAVAEANGRCNLNELPYYWWLGRIIERDCDRSLRNMSPGNDTVAYFLHKAQLCRLVNREAAQRAYADSASALLERDTQYGQSDARRQSYLGLAYANLGRLDSAISYGRRAVELLPTTVDAFDAPFLVVNFAEILMMAGELDSAVEQLEHLMSIPGFVSPAYFRLDPLWNPLRDHPRFARLMTTS